ncbi:MAG: ABC transporter permease [Anaerolineae bacterium]|nr:ABC transporter permease [Anaerolineae bacterium]
MNIKTTRRTPTLWLFGIIIAAIVTFLTSYQVFGGSLETMQETPSWPAVLFVNALVGISVALFVVELKRDALRVLVTVGLALLLGYFVTVVFNMDAASRYTSGEFTVQLISDNEPVENDDTDIEYGRQRGGEFNQPNAAEPLTEVIYTFEGTAGDVVTVAAFAANRRSEVDLQVALLGPDDAVLAEADSVSAEIVEAETYEDVRRETDAVIENYELPTDGIYTIQAKPEDVPFSTSIGEAITQTNVAYEAFLLGPLSRVNRWGVWIQDALTLILLGVAFAIVFRAEQFSLGAEGQLYFGALVSGAIGLALTDLPPLVILPLAIAGSMVAGFLWGLLPGVLKAYLGANELVSTLMLNTIAIRFYELILTYQLKPDDAGYIASDYVSDAAQMAPIVEGTQVTVAVFMVAIVVLLGWLLIRRTPLGYEIRIIGSNIRFADYGGINTKRTIMLAMAISGIVAGLAGAHLALGIHRRLILNISFALAFEGVVVALLARNNVLVTPFTGLMYAYLRAGAQFMERDANVSFEVVRIIQAVIILLITAEAISSFFRQRRIRRRGTTDISETGPPQTLATEPNSA